MLKKCSKRAVVDAAAGEDEVVVEAVHVEDRALVTSVGLDMKQVDVAEAGVLFVLVVSAAVLGRAKFSWWCGAVGPPRTRGMEERILEPFAPACQRPRRASAGGSLAEARAALATRMTGYAKIVIP